MRRSEGEKALPRINARNLESKDRQSYYRRLLVVKEASWEEENSSAMHKFQCLKNWKGERGKTALGKKKRIREGTYWARSRGNKLRETGNH